MSMTRAFIITLFFFGVLVMPLSVHAAVQFIGATTGTNNATMPAGTQVGDILIGVGYRGQNATPVGVPSGWTAIDPSSGSNNNSSRIGFIYVTSLSMSLGNWASANKVIITAYRGVRTDYSLTNLPNFAGVWTGANATVAFPSLTLAGAANTSHILWFGGQRSSQTFSIPVWTRAGTIRAQSLGTNGSIVAADTNGVTNDGSSIFMTTTSSQQYRTYAIEIESSVVPLPTPVVTFTASPTTVALNATSTLTWSATNATSCTASGGWSGTKATSSAQTVGPITQSTTFTLACTGLGGTATSSVTVVPGITIDNVLTTNQGFQVYAFNPNGSTSTIAIRTSAPVGYGVTGAAGGADAEIGNTGSGSELLRVVFDQPVTNAQVQVAWSGSVTSALYTLYNAAGNFVASGTVPVTGDGIEPPFTLDAGGASFSRIDFIALSGRDYLIHSIVLPDGLIVGADPVVTSLAAIGTNAAREYVVADTDGLIQLIGTDFGALAGSVVFSGSWGTATGTLHAVTEGSCATPGWTDTSVCIEVPTSIPNDVYTVTVTLIDTSGTTALAPTLTILPRIASMSPTSVGEGDTLTITGDHLCQTGTCPTSFDAANTITIGGVVMPLVSWSHTSIVVTVPTGVTSGSNTVEVITDNTSVIAGTVTFVPPPTLTFTAATTTVAVGGSTTLTWSSTNTTACTASNGWTGSKATSGSQSTGVILTATTFTLACTGIGGTATSSVTVSTVSIPTVSLTASPASVNSNGTSTLTWSSTNAVACMASGGWSGAKATSGTEITSTLSTTTSFSLSCTNLAGTVTATTTVTVAQPPQISSYTNSSEAGLSGNGGRVGQSITVSGEDFGTACSASNYITIGTYTIPCANVTAWSTTSVTFTVPSGITTLGGSGSSGLSITTNGQTAAPVSFVVYPDITAVAAAGTNTGREGSYIQLIGSAFGSTAGGIVFSGSWGTATATIHMVAEGSCTVAGWTNTSVCIEVPAGIPDNAYTATITLVRSDNATTNAPTFTIAPYISSMSPTSGIVGDVITVSGDHLCQTGTCPTTFDVANTITIGGVTATLISWSHTGIVVSVPSGVTVGANTVTVTTNGVASGAGVFTVISTAPNSPSIDPSPTTGQFSEGNAIAVAGATATTSVTFAASMSASAPASLMLEVEVKLIGIAFNESGLLTSSAVNYNSTAVIGSITTELTDAASYHWRARVRNTTTNELSAWVAFGSNPTGDGSGDGVPANVDLTVATGGPVISGVGTAPNCSAHDLVKDTSARIAWTTSSLLTPITNKVLLATSSAMTNAVEYSASNGTAPQVTLTGLTAETAYFYQVVSADSLGTESILQSDEPHCTFVTEAASKRINKLSEFYICQMHEQDEVWTGGLGVSCVSEQAGAKTFNVFVSEMIATQPVVQTSAFVEVFGIAEAAGDFTITVNVNNIGPKTITVKNPQGSIPFRVLYYLPDGYNLDFPADISASNLLDVQVNGADAVSSMGAKAILNYYYFPTY